VSWVASAVGHLPGAGNLGAAVVLAVVSTGCYATSAVLQEREASRQDAHGAALLRGLVRRPWWWLAVAATVAGAVLHITALVLGPLSLVQPFGVLTLVLALPLGRLLGGPAVTGRERRGAAVVVAGLGAVLAVLPHRAPSSHLPLALVLTTVVAVAALVVGLTIVAARVPGRGAPVARAAAAATCFGFASAMARIVVIGAIWFPLGAALALSAAGIGLGLAQLAYRIGGLGAPLATQILVDPLVAVLIGVTLLGEPVHETPTRALVGVLGLAATAAGLWSLTDSQRSRSGRTDSPSRPRPPIVAPDPLSDSAAADRPRRAGDK
jgi:hypothetical protein